MKKKRFNREAKAAKQPKAGNVFVMPWDSGREIMNPTDFQKQVNSFYGTVYVCASKNSQAVAAANLKLYVKKKTKEQKFLFPTKPVTKDQKKYLYSKANIYSMVRKDYELEEMTDHPVLDLFQNVNKFRNRYDLWEETGLFLELTGNCYWWVIKNQKLGIPEEMWILPSQNVEIVADREKFIRGYAYRKGTNVLFFPESDVIHFRYPNPADMFYGMSPLVSCYSNVVMSDKIKDFEINLMQNQARPEGYLRTEGQLNDVIYERLKDKWESRYGGERKAGKTLILESGLEYQPITFPPKDLGNLSMLKLSREEIANAFGVPISKLTTEAVNLANAQVGEAQYQRDTILPKLTRIEEKLNEKLLPLYDENLVFAYDSPVPTDKSFELSEMQFRLGSYVSPVNEIREELGMDPVDWGDVPLAPQGIGPLGSQQEASPEMPGGAPAEKPKEEEKPKLSPKEEEEEIKKLAKLIGLQIKNDLFGSWEHYG